MKFVDWIYELIAAPFLAVVAGVLNKQVRSELLGLIKYPKFFTIYVPLRVVLCHKGILVYLVGKDTLPCSLTGYISLTH